MSEQPCEACDGSGERRLTRSNSLDPDNWTQCKVCKGEGSVPMHCCPKHGCDLTSDYPPFLYTCTECAIEADRDQLLLANALLRKELNVYKERSDRMNELACYAYQRTNTALMMPPSRPREARAERDQAICDINKKLGGALR